MKILIPLTFVLLSFIDLKAQTPDSGKLTPVENLTGKIKPDSTKLSITDSSKVDTVYIENPLNLIKVGVNPSSAYGFAFISYERVIHYMGSLQVKFEYLGTYNPLRDVDYIKQAYNNTTSITGIGITPELRYYGSEKYAPKGFFVGFYIPFQMATVKVPSSIQKNGLTYTIDETNLNYSLIGIGFDLGYQYIFKNNISIEALVGLGIAKGTFSKEYYYYKYKDVAGNEYESKYFLSDGTMGKAFYPRVELTVGYAFGKWKESVF